MLRWEILEIIEQDGIVVQATLHQPMGQPTATPDVSHLSFAAGHDVYQLISAVLFDGYEPLGLAVAALPNGKLRRFWTFRLQINT